MDIDYYFRLIWHKKRFVFLSCVLTIAITYYLMNLFAPKYAASTDLLIENNLPKTVEIEDFYSPESNNDDYFETQLELLRSRALAQDIIKTLGLERYPEFVIPRLNEWAMFKYQNTKKALELEYQQTEIDHLSEIVFSEDRIISGFQKHLSIIPINRSNLITVKFESVNPELATNIANLLAQRYMEIYLDNKAEVTREVAEQLSSRLVSLKTRLLESETLLAQFQRKNQLIENEEQKYQLRKQELTRLSNSVFETQRSYEDANARHKIALQYTDSQSQALVDIPDSLLSSSTKTLKTQYLNTREKLAKLQLQFQDSYPDIIQQKALSDILSKQIDVEIRKNIVELGGQAELARKKYRQAQQARDAHKESMFIGNDQKSQHNQLKSNVEQNRTLYELFSRRIREAQEAVGLGFVAARIITPAIIPSVPTGPRKLIIYLTLIIVITALSSAIIILSDVFNRRVRYAEKFARHTGLQFIGAIPHLNTGVSKDKLEHHLDNTDAAKNQSFYQAMKNITMRLYSQHLDKECRVYMISSSVPDEGKSTVALNLANGFSRYKRTLLIDSDIRRPSITRSLGLENEPGLTAVGRGISLRSLLHTREDNSKLYILAAGQLVDEPVQFLMSDRFELALKRLRPKFHRIILDTPPILAVNDALLLSRLADKIIFVARSNRTPAKAAELAISKLSFCQEKFEGFILTDVRERDYRHVEGYEDYRDYASYYVSSASEKQSRPC